jgi:hypothetical protein
MSSVEEIAAGLSAEEREALRIMHNGGGAICMAPELAKALPERGLVAVFPRNEEWHDANYQLTDLGRSVVRALQEQPDV